MIDQARTATDDTAPKDLYMQIRQIVFEEAPICFVFETSGRSAGRYRSR